MRFFSLIPVVSSLSMGLAYNSPGFGRHFWNNTATRPNITSSGFVSTTDIPSFELVATIQIEIGNLSGSGVINLNGVGPATETAGLGNLLIPPSPTSGISNQTEIRSTSCHSAFLPDATSALSSQNSSILTSNTTGGNAIPRSTLGQATTSSPISLGLFTGSGVQACRPSDILVFLSVVLVWVL